MRILESLKTFISGILIASESRSNGSELYEVKLKVDVFMLPIYKSKLEVTLDKFILDISFRSTLSQRLSTPTFHTCMTQSLAWFSSDFLLMC
jgi:hypothetical protein